MSVALFYHIKFGFSATTHVDNVDLVTKEAAGHIVCYLHTPSYQGTHCTGKTGIMAKKKSLSGKTQGIWKFCQNTGNLVFPSCKFPDSKGKRDFDICRENFNFFKVCQVSFVSVIVTNYVNWHRENLRSGREITGKTQGI